MLEIIIHFLILELDSSMKKFGSVKEDTACPQCYCEKVEMKIWESAVKSAPSIGRQVINVLHHRIINVLANIDIMYP